MNKLAMFLGCGVVAFAIGCGDGGSTSTPAPGGPPAQMMPDPSKMPGTPPGTTPATDAADADKPAADAPADDKKDAPAEDKKDAPAEEKKDAPAEEKKE